MRAFVEIRRVVLQQGDIKEQLKQIQQRIGEYNGQLSAIYDAIENLLDDKTAQRKWEERERIGFKKQKKMNPYQQLIKALHAYPSKTWINRYFDLQRKLLQTLEIENDDPRLGLSLNKNGSMPVNLGQRYVLRPIPNGSIGCIVPIDFDVEYIEGSVVFEFSSGKMKDAMFLQLNFEKHKPLPAMLWQACLLCCEDILRHCHKSGYRKFHQPLLYDFTMEPAVRYEILSGVNIME